MGTFCVNFHARTDSRDAVAKALARIVHVEALVAAPKNGWITFFDKSASSQDTKQLIRIARSLSKKMQTAVFGFLVHDSDVFQYHLFDQGKLVDQFDSHPDHFGAVTNAMRRKYAGRPELLVRWARAGVRVEDIQSVLTGNSYQFEEERAAAFAVLFDIDRGLAFSDFKDIDDNRAQFLSVISKASPGAKALTEAVANQDLAAVRAALEKGASPNIQHGHWPLLYTPIHDGNLELVKVLREFGAKIEYVRDDGTKVENQLSLAVSSAAHDGRTEILEFLLSETVPPTKLALADALCEAVRRGSLEIVQRLLSAGADVNVLGAGNALALAHAVKRGYRQVSAPQSAPPRPPTNWDKLVQLLLDAGANVNGRQGDGITPLMSAAWNNQVEFVRKLLALGADPNTRLESGLTALMLAISCGYSEIVEVLTPVTEVSRDPSPGSLWAAASAGDLAQVEHALAAAVSPNVLAGQDLNPLLAAAMNKHFDVAARLLEAGANPNFSTKYNGLTPLWFATAHQNEPMMKLLIEAGAIDRNRRRQKS